MTLTEQQKDHWEENGYLAVEGVLPPAEVERLREDADAIEARAGGLSESTDRFGLKAFGDDGGGKRLQQVAEPHEMGGRWMELARDPRILDIVEDLLGPNIQLYYSMFMMKPPRQGFSAPWHQDFAFFVHDRADLLTVQLYADDSTVENGCIQVVPGSHKMGLLNHFKDGAFTEVVQGDTSEFDDGRVEVPMQAGGIVLWHALTLHGSRPNRSERPRRAITFTYKNPEARLMGGAFNSKAEVRSVGMMVRGCDPHGDLLSAI